MQQTYYRITNTTVKPVRKDASGRDARSTVEKVGHYVTFKKENGDAVILPAGKSAILSRLDEGTMNLARGGMVTIQKIEDIAAALKEHTLGRQQEKQATKEEPRTKRAAKAVQMGQDKPAEQKEHSEYEGAINPDGHPNFIATATKKRKPGRPSKKRSADIQT